MYAGQTAPKPPPIGTVIERVGAATISFDADGYSLTISGVIGARQAVTSAPSSPRTSRECAVN
ncbi:MAG: hypothetical protein U1E83_05350 [Methylotetracoccus sp.]